MLRGYLSRNSPEGNADVFFRDFFLFLTGFLRRITLTALVHRRGAESAETYLFWSIGRYRLTKTTQAFGQKFCTFSFLASYAEAFFMIRTEYSISLSSRSYVCFFIFSHSMFDVGRSMFDVHCFQSVLGKNNLAVMILALCPMPFILRLWDDGEDG